MQLIFKIIIFSLFFISCNQFPENKTLLLNSDWEFSKKGDSVWYKANVPGVVHTDLLANDLIEDPFWETNEINLQWIENENWNYKTIFSISKEQYFNEFIELEFEGLDTYADVYLNEELIISASNMFRSWKKEVKSLLKIGKNKLEVKFTSPIIKHKETVNNYPYKLPSGNETVNTKVSPFVRKAAYHFGWDWGPRFVTSGIWKRIKINTWNKARINDVFINTDSIINNKAYLSFILDCNIESALDQEVKVDVSDLNVKFKLNEKDNTITHSFIVENPKLWWPNGMGKPNLNELTFKLKVDNQLIEKRTVNYGIRTVELINEKDSIGSAFYFKINGEPLFIKGANYIPQDIFVPRVSNEQYEKLLSKVIDANMNMLRVWGGGIYEKDIFYELCDKKGILIWQDFMFANSLYPLDKKFLENVEQEIIDNVIRLRTHPSVALWCGNNEIDVAWHNWGWQKQFNYSHQDSVKLWNDYITLFHDKIPSILTKLDSKANYTTTSPISNWGKPENFNHSSMHYWGVWHGKEPFENFETNVGRFMVEYGFQSFPSMNTIRKFASDSSLSLNSQTMINRQKSYIGNGLISHHIKNNLNEPLSFEDFVIKSQQTQAIAYQTAIQAHISQTPHCMGTLFWQLNDCWPGPSWSVIDYYGEEKTAFNTVKENYKPIIAIADFRTQNIEILNNSESLFNGHIAIKINDRVNTTASISIKSNERREIEFDFSQLNSKSFYIELYDDKNNLIFNDVVRNIQ